MSRLAIPAALLALLCLAAPVRAATVLGQPAIETTITDGPAEGSSSEDEVQTFSFAATIDGIDFPAATFKCSLDGAAPVTCASPYEVGPLEEEGLHSFSVYAEDPLTRARDPEPAARSFYIEFEEECEEAEDEDEEVELCEDEDGSDEVPPEECLLRSARAKILASTTRERVRLAIRYTTFAPADVVVGYRLSGGRGPLSFGETRDHFGRKGLFRATERLSKAQMAKVRAAKRFTVEIDVPAAPDSCRRFETRHLTIRRPSHSQVVWLQSDSIFGTSP